MESIKDKIVKEFEKAWPEAQKNVSKMNKEVIQLIKKGEKNVIDIYAQAKKKTGQLASMAKREELYYELGKAIAPLLTSDQLKDKNIMKIFTEIQKLSRKLRSKK